jgi:hypothetical protein
VKAEERSRAAQKQHRVELKRLEDKRGNDFLDLQRTEARYPGDMNAEQASAN